MLARVLFFFILISTLFSCNDKQVIANQDLQDSIDYYITKSLLANTVDEQVFYSSKAELLNNQINNDSFYFANRFKISFSYFNFNKNKEFKKQNEELLSKAISQEDSLNIARAYKNLGEYYFKESINDTAVIYYNLAQKIYFKRNDNLNTGRLHNNIASAKFKSRDFFGAEKSATIALSFLRLENDLYDKWQSYTILGLVSISLKDYDKGEEYLFKALDLSKDDSLIDYYSYETTLNNISLLYIQVEKFKQSYDYANLALQNQLLVEEYPELYASLLNNRASYYISIKNYDLTLEDLNSALQIREALKLNSKIVETYLSFSKFYLSQNDGIKALNYAKLAFETANTTNILNLKVDALSALTNINDNSYKEYSKDFITLNDSLINMERKNSEKFARIEFEADEMRRQNEILNLRNRNIYTLAALIIATLLIVYLFRERRNRLIRLRLLEAQQHANEEIYNLMLNQQQRLEEVVIKEKQRIGQDLHDGVLGRLFGARMNLDSMTKELVSVEAVDSRNHFIKELQEIEQDIREVSHELSREKRSIIDNFMLIFTQLLEDQKSNHKVQLEYDVDATIRWSEVNNNIKINLYRIVQEALQNINKYAQASHIIVIVQMRGKKIHVTITDDGVGFEVDKKSKGIGMKNITSRVEACYGSFSITSKKGEGTKIKVAFPLKFS
ncbi:MAG: ATP-binding protein [Flavobacterium sp.]